MLISKYELLDVKSLPFKKEFELHNLKSSANSNPAIDPTSQVEVESTTCWSYPLAAVGAVPVAQ
jgi:hypothetical protein